MVPSSSPFMRALLQSIRILLRANQLKLNTKHGDNINITSLGLDSPPLLIHLKRHSVIPLFPIIATYYLTIIQRSFLARQHTVTWLTYPHLPPGYHTNNKLYEKVIAPEKCWDFNGKKELYLRVTYADSCQKDMYVASHTGSRSRQTEHTSEKEKSKQSGNMISYSF